MVHPVKPVGVGFAADLAIHGDRLAVTGPAQQALSYRQLADRVEDVAERLGAVRRLVMIRSSHDVDTLITYLAALAGGHPVLLTGVDGAQWDELVDAYDPDVVSQRAGELDERRDGTAHDLHPELALLLSTSGSTGSPKLVRLTAENVQSNAEAIAGYLDIQDTDRPCVSLPLHYSYGLSIVNSNLLRGAGLVLTPGSMIDDAFWDAVRSNGCTSLHGVPHTFDLLEQVGFDRMRLPELRYVTQAGGGMAPDRVRRFAGLGERDGWRFYVMYGQTEATARMAYLPPELALQRPNAVGAPIPGGSFEIMPSDTPGQGELVYRGPNVMLGYARGPVDLARGREIDALHTGDIARRADDGLYEIIGRSSAFIKLFGLRIDLRRIERMLEERGFTAACTGTDDALVVAVETTNPDARGVAEVVRAEVGLPPGGLRVVTVQDLPRLSNGKPDYPAIRELASQLGPGGAESLRDRFAAVLGVPEVPDTASFVDLGGDSLTYVQMAIEIERVLGHLPGDWHLLPVGELQRLAPKSAPTKRLTAVETGAVVRAVSIVLIAGTHLGLFHLLGGAHLLLIAAGWAFARFSLAPRAGTRTSTVILRSAAWIAVPTTLWQVVRWFYPDSYVRITNILLIDNYARQGTIGYWFIEVLVQLLVIMAVLFACGPVRRFERRNGLAFAAIVLAVAFAVHLLAQDTAAYAERSWATHGVAWFFALGWLAQRASTTWLRWPVLGLGVVLLFDYFGQPSRELVVMAGLAVLLLVPCVRLPPVVARLVVLLASASLYIYLTHYVILRATQPYLPQILVLVAGLSVGVLVWALVGWTRTRFSARVRRTGPVSPRSPSR
ncbi:AMP-binding protein [Saccharopolyspora sp. NPDC002376]